MNVAGTISPDTWHAFTNSTWSYAISPRYCTAFYDLVLPAVSQQNTHTPRPGKHRHFRSCIAERSATVQIECRYAQELALCLNALCIARIKSKKLRAGFRKYTVAGQRSWIPSAVPRYAFDMLRLRLRDLAVFAVAAVSNNGLLNLKVVLLDSSR